MTSAAALSFYSGTQATKPDRHFVRSIGEHFIEPLTDETVQLFADQIIKISLHGRSSSPTQDGVRGMEPATALRGRTPLEHRNARITKAHTAERVAFALQAWGKDKSAPIARVQQIAGVDRKTAAAWYRGKSPPQSEHLINLARRIPELQGEVARLMAMDPDQDPRAYSAFLELMRMVQR